MNRREFLKMLALSAGASVALPAAAVWDKFGVEAFPLKAPSYAGDLMVNGSAPAIGMVAVGSGACGMLRNWPGNSPALQRRVAIDTSPFVLHRTQADRSVRVGQAAEKISDPKTLRLQARAAQAEIRDALAGLDLIWLLSSQGGNAGTGIAPIVAEVARALAIPVIAVSVTPFAFEGERRSQVARAGLNAITRRVMASIELPNEAYITDDDDETLESVLGRVTSDLEQLYRATTLVLGPQGLIGVDLADVRAVTARAQGTLAIGHGAASGPEALRAALSAAANHRLLGEDRLRQAKGAFVAVELKSDRWAMSSVGQLMQAMGLAVNDPAALLIYGVAVEPDLPSDVRISIMAAL